MNAGQVLNIAKEWIETEGSKMPGFSGAHLMGSLNSMPLDAPFPSFRDVDFNIISREVQQEETHDVAYEGLILEYGLLPLADYQTPETILANPALAANVAAPSVLADPLGILSELHQTVAAEYARRKWVQARCEREKKTILDFLKRASQAQSSLERTVTFGLALVDLAGLLALARVKPPTHRRCLVLMRELLQAEGRLDLHERTLNVLGFADMNRAEVESYLRQAATAFDCALEVHRTPTPLDFKLQAHIKPYFIEGSQQIIDQGFHREAMIWVEACYLISTMTIAIDAPPADQQKFMPAFQSFIERCGLGTPESSQRQIAQARALASDLFALADTWVDTNPAIVP